MRSALKCFILICEAMATFDPESCKDIHMTIQSTYILKKKYQRTNVLHPSEQAHCVCPKLYFKVH